MLRKSYGHTPPKQHQNFSKKSTDERVSHEKYNQMCLLAVKANGKIPKALRAQKPR